MQAPRPAASVSACQSASRQPGRAQSACRGICVPLAACCTSMGAITFRLHMLLTALRIYVTTSCCLVPPCLRRCSRHSALLQLLAVLSQLQQLPTQLLIPGFRGCHLLLALHRLLVSSLLGPGQMCLQRLYLTCSHQGRLHSDRHNRASSGVFLQGLLHTCRNHCMPSRTTITGPAQVVQQAQTPPAGMVKGINEGFTVTDMQCQGKLAHIKRSCLMMPVCPANQAACLMQVSMQAGEWASMRTPMACGTCNLG